MPVTFDGFIMLVMGLLSLGLLIGSVAVIWFALRRID